MDTINLVAFITGRQENAVTERYDDNNDRDLQGFSVREILKIHWSNWMTCPRNNPRKGRPYNWKDFLKASVISFVG